MSPHIALALYVGVGVLFGFLGMMYLHAIESQGKKTSFDGIDVFAFSVFWFAVLPLAILAGTLCLINLLAKKASFILTPREEK